MYCVRQCGIQYFVYCMESIWLRSPFPSGALRPSVAERCVCSVRPVVFILFQSSGWFRAMLTSYVCSSLCAAGSREEWNEQTTIFEKCMPNPFCTEERH